MADPTVVVAAIGAGQAVIVAVISGIFAKLNADAKRRADEQAERDRAREEHEARREERDTCMYDLVFSTVQGVEVLLHQAHGDKVNGNVDDALESIKNAKSECNHLFNKQAAKM